jgi:hypothetical protein
MAIGTVIYTKLSAVEADCYPVVAPQGVQLPYITYQTVSVTPDDTKNSVSDFDKWRVQVNIFAVSQSAAETLAASCRTALDLLRATVGSVTVLDSRFDGQVDMSEPDEDYYHIAQDYILTTR